MNRWQNWWTNWRKNWWMQQIAVHHMSIVTSSRSPIKQQSRVAVSFQTLAKVALNVPFATGWMRQVHPSDGCASCATHRADSAAVLTLSIEMVSRIAPIDVRSSVVAQNVLVARSWAGRENVPKLRRSNASRILERHRQADEAAKCG